MNCNFFILTPFVKLYNVSNNSIVILVNTNLNTLKLRSVCFATVKLERIIRNIGKRCFLYSELSVQRIYGSAIFMTRHILSSFSIKKQEIKILLDGLIANDTITIIKRIYSIYFLAFIVNDRLQSTLESFTGGNQYFLSDQGPFS